MASIFTKIINGEIPAHVVAQTDRYLAFLDVRPMTEGHTLCVPKEEVDYIFDLDDEQYAGLMAFAKHVATGLKEVVPCKRIAVGVLGLEVPHAHVHLVPVNSEGDFRFGKSIEVTEKRQTELAEKIRAATS